MKRPKKYPKSAKRVYASPEFDVWEWPQKMFDGSTKIFRRAVQTSGVSVIASTKNKIILLEEKQPGTPWYYTVAGGTLDDPNETPRQAAHRELLEESGYKPKTLKLWKVLENPGRLFHKRYIFIAASCKKISEPLPDRGEKIKVLLLNFRDLLKFSEHPRFFKGFTYVELLKARADKKYANSLKQALFGKKKGKTR